MDPINFIKKEEVVQIKTKKRIIYSAVFVITGIIVFTSNIIISDQESSWLSRMPIISHIKRLVESADKNLKGEDRDRINILLLGMGGKGHEAGYLADTIMVASIEPSSEKAAMISIPRDMTVPIEGTGWKKVNNVNAFAEAKNPGSGGVATSQAIGDVLGMPIDYYVSIDFEGFINIVDELGGIKIYVENTIDDTSYPVMGMENAQPYESRFEHLYIEKGWQEMDGALALKYARSRHSVGVEGSDFARAKRQQKVLEAAKDKLLSFNTLLHPGSITGIIEEAQSHIKTNLKTWEMIKLWSLGKNIERNKITNKVLDNRPNGLLIDMITADGAYILTPRSGDFTEIQYMVNNIFSDAPEQAKTKVSKENALIEIRNGTWINGLATQVALDLEKYGFKITNISNASQQNFEKSVIYDLTYGEKLESLAILKDKAKANISYNLPQWLIDDIKQELNNNELEQPDFILILGQDADKTSSGLENIEND